MERKFFMLVAVFLIAGLFICSSSGPAFVMDRLAVTIVADADEDEEGILKHESEPGTEGEEGYTESEEESESEGEELHFEPEPEEEPEYEGYKWHIEPEEEPWS